MSGLRIGGLNLPAKDSAYLRALVRLFSYSDKISWSFVDEAPFDALVMHPDTAATHAADLAAFNGSVLTLVSARRGNDELDYPVRADQFRDWLKSKDPGTGADPATPGQPTGAAAAAPARYKLRRWPSVQQLRGDPLRIRMATLMSKQAFSSAELALATELDDTVCAGFIAALQDANLLVSSSAAPALPAPPFTGAAAPATAHPKAGLLASLRRRFGL